MSHATTPRPAPTTARIRWRPASRTSSPPQAFAATDVAVSCGAIALRAVAVAAAITAAIVRPRSAPVLLPAVGIAAALLPAAVRHITPTRWVTS